MEADLQAPTMEELCRQLEDDDGTYQTHMEIRLHILLKEAREKSKHWVSCPSTDNTELYYKKVSCARIYEGVKKWHGSDILRNVGVHSFIYAERWRAFFRPVTLSNSVTYCK